jgi:UDP-N-acetylglucosamine acyltransferase
MNKIHPTAIVDSSVVIGEGNVIGPYAVILGNVHLGNDNWIGPHVAIGTPAQMRGGPHPATWGGEVSSSFIEIGSRNVIREFATVHAGTVDFTRIGNDCYFMTQSHVPHDAQIEDEVTLSNSVQLGGHTIIQSGANIGLGAVIHQRSLIGTRAMVGMGSVVTKAIPPYGMAFGSPARVRGGNVIGMQRAGLHDNLIQQVTEALNQADIETLRRIIPEEMTRFDEAQASHEQ